MSNETKVGSMKLKTRSVLTQNSEPNSPAEWTELPPKRSFGETLLRTDKLLRNLAVVGAMLLTVVAVKNAGLPQSQSVFSAITQSAGMEWDESLGKLSFVDGLLPDGIQAVWSRKEQLTVFAPVAGDTVHAWTVQEPYIELASAVSDVRAVADGEVMSIAHGLGEERIVRVRHDDETESLYGNLSACLAEVGDRVYAGDVIASLMEGKPLAFELRKDGRSINPDRLLRPLP